MTPQRPFMPHELDVHPDRLRIIATMKAATDSVKDDKLEKEIETLETVKDYWAKSCKEAQKELYDANLKLVRIQEILHATQ